MLTTHGLISLFFCRKVWLFELVNALLQGKEVIKSLTLLPTEQLGDTKDDRRSVFDIYCENEQGDKIIIEMQKADQQWFKDRSVYYSSFPIRQQGEKRWNSESHQACLDDRVVTELDEVKGQWRFGLKAVYTIGILDFVFDEDKDDQEYYRHCLILNKVDTKSLKKYGETTKREPLCEGHRSH